jgi:hypothetical protein
MLFGYLLLAVALTISLTAAFYSIAGLTAIFAAAFWPIVIMGSVLELGKVITTVWLHKYWDRVAVQFKLYLVPAIGILMLITSMGIFGFLSKAHLDQAVPAGDISSQVQIFDDKIKTERDNIEAARKALKQMDAQVDEKLSRTTDDKGAERAVQIRRAQAKERTNLQNEISTAQKKISSLQEQRAPIASQARKVEAEVGPIKYIAALIYGDNPDANILEKAVRWVIILIVLVFDPLALVLILAADQTFEWAREDKKKTKDWDDAPESEAKGFFERGKDLARKLDAGKKIKDWPPYAPDFPDRETPKYELDDGQLTDEQYTKIQELADKQMEVEKTPPIKKPRRNLRKVISEGPKPEPIVEVISEPIVEVIPEPLHLGDPPPLRGRPAPAMDEEPINLPPKAVVIHETPAQVVIPDFSIGADQTNNINAGFGTAFPQTPAKGDMFLRVDMLPSKLYKWNEKKWIEVDKERTDQFAYDQEYIKHLVEKIDRGEYDVDLLTAAEEEQIQRYLKNGNIN